MVSSAELISDDDTLFSLSVSLTVDDIEDPSEISGGVSDNGEFSIPIKKSIIARAIAIPLLIFALSFKNFLIGSIGISSIVANSNINVEKWKPFARAHIPKIAVKIH